MRQQLKTTPEERNTISGRLKEIDVAKKKRMQIRNGVIDYFDSPQVYAEIGRRKVREAQDFLLAGKGKRTDSALIYLDAWFNPELDKDPGAFSGDCTVGKPLPFNRADILAYNVKVFTSQEEHIGNMYLLVTKEAGVEAEGFVEDSKVWHFDAMQIPKTGIDWKVSVPAIFNSLANAAMAKGDIEVITVNSEDHLISNYDYIQEAVKKYWEETSKEETEVDIPQFIPEEDYSNFQGNGEALVLWRKEVTIA